MQEQMLYYSRKNDYWQAPGADRLIKVIKETLRKRPQFIIFDSQWVIVWPQYNDESVTDLTM